MPRYENQLNFLAQQRNALQSQQQEIASRQAEASRTEQQIEARQKEITSQQALRSQDLAGFRVRNINLQNIQMAQSQLAPYQKNLTETSQKLLAYEQNVLKPAEQEVQSAIAEEQAYEVGTMIAQNSPQLVANLTGREKYYAQEFLKGQGRVDEVNRKITAVNEGRIGLTEAFSREQLQQLQRAGMLVNTTRAEVEAPQSILSYSKTTAVPTEKNSFFSNVGSYLYGEKGQRFVSLPSKPGLFGDIASMVSKKLQSSNNTLSKETGVIIGVRYGGATGSEVKKTLSSSSNLPLKVIGEVIPTTPTEVALVTGTPIVFSKSPAVLRIIGSSIFGFQGIKQAFNKELPPEKRIVGGIIGGLGATGSILETTPYISGLYKPITNPIKTQEILGKPVQVISNVPSKTGETYNIALIPSGNQPTGNQPAFTSTAYGFSPEYQATYIGKTGTVVTSARGLIPTGTQIITRIPKDYSILKNEVTPSMEVFATPFDIKTGMAQTRVSRLGTVEALDLFRFPENSQISFGINKPQIVSFENAKITKEGGGGTFKAIGKPSTELEVTTTENIYGQKVGTTKIGLTAVDIFSGKLIGNNQIIPKGFVKISSSPSIGKTSSGYSTISSGFASRLFSPTSASSTSISQTSSSISWVSSPSIKPSAPYSPRAPSTSIPSIASPPSLPSVISRPSAPSMVSTPSKPSPSPTTPTKTNISIFYKSDNRKISKPLSSSSRKRKAYSLFLKRFGKYRQVASGLPLGKATQIGVKQTLSNLGRTFKLKESGTTELEDVGFRVPRNLFREPKNKAPLTYVQRQGIQFKPEISEIQMFRRQKNKKSKKIKFL